MADPLNVSCEPMDVDLSLNSQKSFNESKEFKTSESNMNEDSSNQQNVANLQGNVKVYHINYERGDKTDQRASFFIELFRFLFLFFVAKLTYDVYSINCCEPLDLPTLEENLHRNLHGQGSAIKQILETLQNERNTKMMFFYGGTGVGKTYAASFILNGSWNCTNVYHYTAPSFTDSFMNSTMYGVKVCKSAFIVVDDLTIDSNIIAHISEIVTKSENTRANITIILIYNCNTVMAESKSACDDSFRIKLQYSFAKVNALQKFIRFESLAKEHLRKCIEDTMESEDLTDDQFEELSRNFDVASDGCKRVGSKMKFLNVKV